MSTSPARPRLTDRLPKAGARTSAFAERSTNLEAALREEFAVGTVSVVTASGADAADRIAASSRQAGRTLAMLLFTGAVLGVVLTARTGWPSPIMGALGAFVMGGAAVLLLKSNGGLNAAAVARQLGTDVPAVAGAAIESLRGAVARLEAADAPQEVIDAAATLAAQGEARLDALTEDAGIIAADDPAVLALVRDAAKVLSLIAVVTQRPETALAAAAEALAEPKKRR